jgi:hypothetical protein
VHTAADDQLFVMHTGSTAISEPLAVSLLQAVIVDMNECDLVCIRALYTPLTPNSASTADSAKCGVLNSASLYARPAYSVHTNQHCNSMEPYC